MAESRVSHRKDVRLNSPVAVEIRLKWPWWLHPVWAVILLTGATAVVSVLLPEESYALWGTAKYVGPEQAGILLLGIAVFIVGLLLVTSSVLRGGAATVRMSVAQITYLRKAYRVLFVLTAVGYVAWAASAAIRGVGIGDIMGVLTLQPGAISGLKANATPIGGITTLTQFGLMAVAIGAFLNAAGLGNRSYWWFVVLAGVRAVFYAERLAVIEVILSLTVAMVGVLYSRNTKSSRVLAVAPLVGGPFVWAIFATFEYTRSWVYYQHSVTQGYFEWVTVRLLGYYVTSFNNSGLIDQLRGAPGEIAYFSVSGFWNFPFVDSLLHHPGYDGMSPSDWWWWAINTYSNPEFTNPGTFLTTHAEFGLVGMLLYWLSAGVLIGLLYVLMRRGSLIALFGFASLYVGLLELPRIIYWSEGRAFPTLLALLVMAVTYPAGGGQKNTKGRQ